MKKTLSLLLAMLLLVCLMAGCGASEPEAAAPEAPAAAPAAPEAPAAPAVVEVTWESYLNWLADTFGANFPNPDDYRNLLFQTASWDDVDPTVGPWDRILGEDYFNASTWDEFVAAGGVGTYNEDFQDDALTGSGEASGEPSAEPAA